MNKKLTVIISSCIVVIVIGVLTLISKADPIPRVDVRFSYQSYNPTTKKLKLGVEFKSDERPNRRVFGMNVRYFYDANMFLPGNVSNVTFTDFTPGYGAFSPNPPIFITSPVPNVGWNMFHLPPPPPDTSPSVTFVNGAIELIDPSAPPIELTSEWTRLFSIETISTNTLSGTVCSPFIWDKEADPNNGGFLTGDDGVIITFGDNGDEPTNAYIENFNWTLNPDATGAPWGDPNQDNCVDVTPPMPPMVYTDSATVTTTTVTLNGTVKTGAPINPRGFQYGITNAYGNTVTQNGSFPNESYSASVSSLYCGTLYHYRAYATNIGGTSYGVDKTFTTSSCPKKPTVQTNDATNITKISATLNGAITATGGENASTRGFNYGLTTNYTASTAENGSFGVGAFSANISALSCGKTYHFRGYAINSGGIGYGKDMTLKTKACTGN